MARYNCYNSVHQKVTFKLKASPFCITVIIVIIYTHSILTIATVNCSPSAPTALEDGGGVNFGGSETMGSLNQS